MVEWEKKLPFERGTFEPNTKEGLHLPLPFLTLDPRDRGSYLDEPVLAA